MTTRKKKKPTAKRPLKGKRLPVAAVLVDHTGTPVAEVPLSTPDAQTVWSIIVKRLKEVVS